MTLRQTIMFIPKGELNVVRIEVYVADEHATFGTGLWNIDENKILLSPSLYSEFRTCKTQLLQRKFFDGLRKVSSRLL
ncbi:MAG: hypothetical protein JWQ96_2710 [Segetibacter sp.]|nr:hypothetical protein [Segetibacter sp.]